MKLPPARTGELLRLKDRELDFSFYPMTRSNRRWGIHSTLYAADPWAVIAGSVNEGISASSDKAAAASFVRQAHEYFSAAERAASIETRPLLYYYSFLNLAKAIAMGRGRSGLVGKVSHGIGHVGGAATGHTPSTARLQVGASDPAVGGTKSAIDELHWALEGRGVTTGHYSVSEIIPQSVIAHRMWREAFEQPRKERFIPVDEVHFLQDAAANQVWLSLYISRATLLARGRGLKEVMSQSTLDASYGAVSVHDATVSSKYHVLEQRHPTAYSGRAADVVVDAVKGITPALWQTVTAHPPYRRYYLYLSPPGERRMPQWLSVYATLFWLGSLTRYQPVELFDALDGKYGPFFREFLETQPKQLLYMLASDAKQQNVTRAAIV
ncbi:YaaC family protein [Arthrobacter sp. zg-Y411]|uniref:YaaC family protein n=1 Tax=Arthrobacter zhangbolii TaxID=2886936 RepID=UPI001D135EAD|nr:YaaC family protein [Arthrobacter zhangbolii]MCC3295560.1 YaaC family protein [Arthrobacter zhangbolii]